MKTQVVQLDEISVTVREFTLDSYPEAQTAIEGLASDDKAAKRDAIKTLLQRCTDTPPDKTGSISIREWRLVLDAILELNGFTKKVEAPSDAAKPEAGATN